MPTVTEAPPVAAQQPAPPAAPAAPPPAANGAPAAGTTESKWFKDRLVWALPLGGAVTFAVASAVFGGSRFGLLKPAGAGLLAGVIALFARTQIGKGLSHLGDYFQKKEKPAAPAAPVQQQQTAAPPPADDLTTPEGRAKAFVKREILGKPADARKAAVNAAENHLDAATFTLVVSAELDAFYTEAKVAGDAVASRAQGEVAEKSLSVAGLRTFANKQALLLVQATCWDAGKLRPAAARKAAIEAAAPELCQAVQEAVARIEADIFDAETQSSQDKIKVIDDACENLTPAGYDYFLGILSENFLKSLSSMSLESKLDFIEAALPKMHPDLAVRIASDEADAFAKETEGQQLVDRLQVAAKRLSAPGREQFELSVAEPYWDTHFASIDFKDHPRAWSESPEALRGALVKVELARFRDAVFPEGPDEHTAEIARQWAQEGKLSQATFDLLMTYLPASSEEKQP